MKHAKLAVIAALTGLVLATPALAGPYDNFPLEDSAAKAVRARAAAAPASTAPATPQKVCFLFNPPSFDRQWQVACDPKAPTTEPTKMCRIMTTTGWDAALFTEPCENQVNRAKAGGK